LTRLSFHNLESDSPTSSTTERETIVHGVIFSVCWCSQFPLRFAGFLPSFSGKKKYIYVKWDQWIWLIPVAERRASFCHTHFSSSPCCQRTLAETGGVCRCLRCLINRGKSIHWHNLAASEAASGISPCHRCHRKCRGRATLQITQTKF
jgi:hypothetical protein